MSIDTKIQYKSETGNLSFISIESERLTQELDARIMEENIKCEIIDLIDYDSRYNAKWGIFMDQLPIEYKENEDLKIPSPEYVKWLEEKVIYNEIHKI